MAVKSIQIWGFLFCYSWTLFVRSFVFQQKSMPNETLFVSNVINSYFMEYCLSNIYSISEASISKKCHLCNNEKSQDNLVVVKKMIERQKDNNSRCNYFYVSIRHVNNGGSIFFA